MALLSLGRNVAIAAEHTSPVIAGDNVDEVRDNAQKKIEDARKGLLATLTPWIPGDFVVTYGLLLSAWKGMQGSFLWLLIVSFASAFAFVVVGAFSITGFKCKADRSAKVVKQLAIRTLAGAGVSLYAAAAIPNSGWYYFGWFRDNELAWVVTAGIIVVPVTLILQGTQKKYRWT